MMAANLRWIGFAALLAAAPSLDTVEVKREGVRVMKAPRFFGEACGVSVSAGQRVGILERRGAWARLAAPGDGKCWIHASAWSDRTAGELVGNATVASQRDVELAGRGFSEEETAHYAAENPDLKPELTILDAYLARAPELPTRQLTAFLAEGKLGGGR